MCPICVYKLVLLNASSYQLPEMLVLQHHALCPPPQYTGATSFDHISCIHKWLHHAKEYLMFVKEQITMLTLTIWQKTGNLHSVRGYEVCEQDGWVHAFIHSGTGSIQLAFWNSWYFWLKLCYPIVYSSDSCKATPACAVGSVISRSPASRSFMTTNPSFTMAALGARL